MPVGTGMMKIFSSKNIRKFRQKDLLTVLLVAVYVFKRYKLSDPILAS
jgi:hypothetical protein